MHTFDEVGTILDEIVDTLPEGIARGLNGGVYLIPELKPHERLPCPDYVVMGEYVKSGPACLINIYYGSLMACYVDADMPELRRILEKVVCHEFRHHVESRAGIRDLELEDEAAVRHALLRIDQR